MAETFNSGHIVGDEEDRPPSTSQTLHFAQALLLKLGVADCQHLSLLYLKGDIFQCPDGVFFIIVLESGQVAQPVKIP